jgi:hypothetical protein
MLLPMMVAATGQMLPSHFLDSLLSFSGSCSNNKVGDEHETSNIMNLLASLCNMAQA